MNNYINTITKTPRRIVVAVIILIFIFLLLVYLNLAKPNKDKGLKTSIDTIPSQKQTTPGGLTPLLKEKPWIQNLPIKDPNYYVDYDPITKTVKAQLFTITSFSIPKEMQIEHLQNEVKFKLIELDADLNKEKIEWIIK